MAKIQINNPRQTINGGAKKYYFKVKGLGGPKGDKGDTGSQGPQGPQGPQGNAATVSVGSTTTLAVGQDATVTNSGSIYNAVLDFGIPQGPQGPKGAKGDKGDTGAQGETGPRGPQGEKGTNATVYVGTTTTTNPGTQARVYNSGTDSNAVLNFEIPRGDVGPSVPLVQETGNSATKAMSQNATTEALNGKQNTLTAGSNIQISGSTISATDTKYSAGNGITLTGTQFSANTSVLATKNDLGSYYTKTQIDSQMGAKQDDLVAGSNIQIAPDGKTISATDTTYTAGNGLNLNGTEFSADTTVLATQTDLTTALASKLEAEVAAELPTTGTEGKLYLTPKNYTTGTATGNPITISLSEDAGQITSFKLDGDTAQQTYTGKNLLNLSASRDFTSGTDYSFDASSGVLAVTMSSAPAVNRYSGWRVTGITAGAKYTFSIESFTNSALSNTDRAIMIRSHNGTTASELATLNKTQTSYTFTAPNDSVRLDFFFYIASGDTDSTSIITKPMLEAGETATTYEPFVGGQPSPNPDYPQPIQTVTGEQTVSINGTDYPLDLGTVELCKLGTYQDYIYKDGDDWKMHEAIAKVTIDGSTKWVRWATNVFYSSNANIPTPVDAESICYSDKYVGLTSQISAAAFVTQAANYNYAIDTHRNNPIMRVKNTDIDSADGLKTWFANNPTLIYYPRAFTSDTTITDTNLIAQLEAIRTAPLQNGANTITNIATAPNLAGDMEIGYYGYNPRNRYDKWLWLDINNEYEQIGS